METGAYRELFPVIRTQVFFNHAAISAPSQRVVEAVAGFMRECATDSSLGYRRWMARLEEVRRQAAQLLGAESEEIAFVDNTSQGRSGILTFRVEADPAAGFGGLLRRGVMLSLRQGQLRLAPHFYNDRQDVEHFFAALDTVLQATGQAAGGSLPR